MSRKITIPEQTVLEDISQIDETPNVQVRFTVGKKDDNGNWIVPQQFQIFIVAGEQYTELNGPALDWCPDKPTGTYRNQDLWHYVDLTRLENT
jgi:hypothetical protein